jgi:hypothetical protein
MKYLIASLFLLTVTFAQADECRYSKKELTKIDSDRYSDEVRDFLENDRYGDDWACLMKKRHLNSDSLKNCFPAEEDVFNFSISKTQTVTGKIRYMGLIPQAYKYDVSPEGIEVRIAFRGELGNDQEALKKVSEKLAFASEIWTKNSPEGSLPFHFKLVGLSENPHFTPKLVNKASGTKFNSLWAIDDTKMVVAHEVGHMLGLNDEYPIIRSMVWQVKNSVDTRMCNLRSLMCDYYSSSAKPYPYAYYTILRRAYCLEKSI